MFFPLILGLPVVSLPNYRRVSLSNHSGYDAIVKLLRPFGTVTHLKFLGKSGNVNNSKSASVLPILKPCEIRTEVVSIPSGAILRETLAPGEDDLFGFLEETPS